MTVALKGEHHPEAWEQWLLDVADADGDELQHLLRDGMSRPPWVWGLAKDVCGLKASPEDMFWLLYRSNDGDRHAVFAYPLHEDFPLLRAVFRAATNDQERWFALEESIWASEILEGDNCHEAVRWLSTIQFADPRMQARYLARILAPGTLGTKVFDIPSESIDDFVRSVRKAAQPDGALGQFPDFVQLGLPAAFLVARALQDGRRDIARAMSVRLDKRTWTSVLELLPEWDSNSAWMLSQD